MIKKKCSRGFGPSLSPMPFPFSPFSPMHPARFHCRRRRSSILPFHPSLIEIHCVSIIIYLCSLSSAVFFQPQHPRRHSLLSLVSVVQLRYIHSSPFCLILLFNMAIYIYVYSLFLRYVVIW
jgi:hypothetical protein